jgi:hypothetical protein
MGLTVHYTTFFCSLLIPNRNLSNLLCISLIFTGRENRDLDILIFKEVLDNMARVDRVLTKPGGSLLMAGQSGAGRRTAVLLVAHMHMMQLCSPKVFRGYSMKHFKNDLKHVSITGKKLWFSPKKFEPITNYQKWHSRKKNCFLQNC